MPCDHSESEKAAAREVRDRLRDLERLANSAQLGMLGYLLRLAIVEADEVIGDTRDPVE